MTHHLCVVRGEVRVEWQLEPFTPELEASGIINLMLCPWPLALRESAISPARNNRNDEFQFAGDGRFGWFDYTPSYDFNELEKILKSDYGKYKRLGRTPHLLIRRCS